MDDTIATKIATHKYSTDLFYANNFRTEGNFVIRVTVNRQVYFVLAIDFYFTAITYITDFFTGNSFSNTG